MRLCELSMKAESWSTARYESIVLYRILRFGTFDEAEIQVGGSMERIARRRCSGKDGRYTA